MAYALGYFGQKTRHDLHALRKIRNAFAHNIEQTDLGSYEAQLKGFHCIQADLNAREILAEITHRMALYLIWLIAKREYQPDTEYRRLIRNFD